MPNQILYDLDPSIRKRTYLPAHEGATFSVISTAVVGSYLPSAVMHNIMIGTRGYACLSLTRTS